MGNNNINFHFFILNERYFPYFIVFFCWFNIRFRKLRVFALYHSNTQKLKMGKTKKRLLNWFTAVAIATSTRVLLIRLIDLLCCLMRWWICYEIAAISRLKAFSSERQNSEGSTFLTSYGKMVIWRRDYILKNQLRERGVKVYP